MRRSAATLGYGVQPLRGCRRQIFANNVDARAMPQRSKVIIGLLFAATIAVDLVALFLAHDPNTNRAAEIAMALFFAQINLACIWAVLSGHHIGVRAAAPFLLGSLAALLIWAADDDQEWEIHTLVAFGLVFWIEAGLVVIVLWGLRPMRRFSSKSGKLVAQPWQFSVRNLFVLMTGLAVLLTLANRIGLSRVSLGIIAIDIASSLALVVAALEITTTHWHWLQRLAATVGIAVLIGAICQRTLDTFRLYRDLISFQLVQAVLLFIWLELGQFLPPRTHENGVEK